MEFLLENGAKVDSQDDGEYVYVYCVLIFLLVSINCGLYYCLNSRSNLGEHDLII